MTSRFRTKLSGSFSVAPIHAVGNVYGAETNAMIIRKFIKKNWRANLCPPKDIITAIIYLGYCNRRLL